MVLITGIPNLTNKLIVFKSKWRCLQNSHFRSEHINLVPTVILVIIRKEIIQITIPLQSLRVLTYQKVVDSIHFSVLFQHCCFHNAKTLCDRWVQSCVIHWGWPQRVALSLLSMLGYFCLFIWQHYCCDMFVCLYTHTVSYCSRVGNTKHENVVFCVSCISIQTRWFQVETRNKHEKLNKHEKIENSIESINSSRLHCTLKCILHCTSPSHLEILMLVSFNSTSSTYLDT